MDKNKAYFGIDPKEFKVGDRIKVSSEEKICIIYLRRCNREYVNVRIKDNSPTVIESDLDGNKIRTDDDVTLIGLVPEELLIELAEKDAAENPEKYA